MAVPYVDGFEPYSLEDRRDAIGEFPEDRAKQSRLAHLPPPPSTGGWSRPSLASGGEADEAAEAVEQCNDSRWFREPSSSGAAGASKGAGKGKRQRKGPPLLWPELNPPRDENDWLAQVNEAGQDFGDYTDVSNWHGCFSSGSNCAAAAAVAPLSPRPPPSLSPPPRHHHLTISS